MAFISTKSSPIIQEQKKFEIDLVGLIQYIKFGQVMYLTISKTNCKTIYIISRKMTISTYQLTKPTTTTE